MLEGLPPLGGRLVPQDGCLSKVAGMSQIASYTRLPVVAVRMLIPAAMVKRRLFRKPESRFREYLKKHGQELGIFDGDGFYVVLVLLYLKSYCGVNLIDANRGLALMARSLSKHQGGFFAFLTPEDRMHEKAIRGMQVDACELKELCALVGADYELYSHVGTLKSAAQQIADLLAGLPDDHVILVCVG